MSPEVTSTPFGEARDGSIVSKYRLSNGGSLIVDLVPFGARIVAVYVRDRFGQSENVTLGFPTLAEYLGEEPYFGCTVGRFANRISGGTFTLDGRRYEIPANDPPNALHGGPDGFDRRMWHAHADGGRHAASVAFTTTSADGDQGFPGSICVGVTYTVNTRSELRIDYRAVADRSTVVNLTNHAYWNLAGEKAETIDDHLLWITAPRYTPIDETMIPTGSIEPVVGTPLDFFSAAAPVGARVGASHEQLERAGGYDHNFVLAPPRDHALRRAAVVFDPASGRELEVLTTEPGLQLYSGNQLDGSILGVGGRRYTRRSGLALETQHFPDSPNRPHFPSTVLRPGEVRTSSTIYRFSSR